MHEFGIIQSIFQALEKIALENHLSKITIVTLRIGKLRQVVPENLQFAFETLAKDTKASGAKLILIEEPIKMRCQTCLQEFIVQDQTYLCPKCGASDLITLTGQEIVLENIEGAS